MPLDEQSISKINMNGSEVQVKSKKQMDYKADRKLEKMRTLGKLQAGIMQSMIQKVDRMVKPIKKNTEIVTACLENKSIFLDEENFDILKLI